MFVISRSPYRISLLGSSTDYQSYWSHFGAIGLSFAINKYSYITCSTLSEIVPFRYQLSYSSTESVNSIEEIKHDGVRGTLDALNFSNLYPYRLSIVHNSSLIKQSGLGTSSAFVCALLKSLSQFTHEQFSKETIASMAIYIERSKLNQAGGYGDAISSAYGGFNSIHYNKNTPLHETPFTVRPLPLSKKFLDEFRDNSCLLYLGSPRDSFEVAKEHSKPETLTIKHEFKRLAYLGLDAFYKEDLGALVNLIDLSWQQKIQISPLISSPEISRTYNIIREVGGVSCKVLGAGGGGFMFCLGDKDKLAKVIELSQLTKVEYNYDWDGAKTIFVEK